MRNKLMQFCEENGLLRQHPVDMTEYMVTDVGIIEEQLEKLKSGYKGKGIDKKRVDAAVSGGFEAVIAAAHGTALYGKLCRLLDLKKLFRCDELYSYTRGINNFEIIYNAIKEAEASEKDWIFSKALSYADIVCSNFSIYCSGEDSITISALTYDSVKLTVKIDNYNTRAAYSIVKIIAYEMFRLSLNMYNIADIKDMEVPDIFHALYVKALDTGSDMKYFKSARCIIKFGVEVPDNINERRAYAEKMMEGYAYRSLPAESSRDIKEGSKKCGGVSIDTFRIHRINIGIESIEKFKEYAAENQSLYAEVGENKALINDIKNRISCSMHDMDKSTGISRLMQSVKELINYDTVFDEADLSERNTDDNKKLIIERKLDSGNGIVYVPLFMINVKCGDEDGGTSEVEMCTIVENIAFSVMVKTGIDKSSLIDAVTFMMQAAVCGISYFAPLAEVTGKVITLNRPDYEADYCRESGGVRLFADLIQAYTNEGTAKVSEHINDTHYSLEIAAEFIGDEYKIIVNSDNRSRRNDEKGAIESKDDAAHGKERADVKNKIMGNHSSGITKEENTGWHEGDEYRGIRNICEAYGMDFNDYIIRIKHGETEDEILKEAAERKEAAEDNIPGTCIVDVDDKSVENTVETEDSVNSTENSGCCLTAKIKSIVNIGCRFIIVSTEDGKLYSAGYDEIKALGIFPVERIHMDEIIEYNGIEVSGIELKERRFAEPDTDAVKEILKHFWD